ncbi:MAG TPA: tetratricopeptide repeat protein [Candidatus Angelobacter sp.]
MPASAPADQTLTIKHVAGSDPASFLVVRQRDSKTSQPIAVVSPVGFPVEGRPNSDLMRELQWYLETFLDYPFPPETEHAERVLKALRDWGEQAFRALFEDRAAGRMFDDATRDYSRLHLRISSDDPRVLAWPWEALRDPELGFLAQACQVVRQLNTVRDPQELPESLPKDRVNILLVVARPFEQDVRFRTLARPLVELIEREKLPASVELLRPPTFDHLREHLREHPGHYHILHFDGHGGFSENAPGTGGHMYQGPEGKLVFETEDGEPDLIPAEKLSVLLKEYAVPGVVLNACQSAMTATDSSDPFASVAMALLKSGMRDVVAMAYSLYVSGAQQFLPPFYQRLFDEGSMAVAVKAGRQEMWQHDKRVCVRGEFPLQDWLLPVLYQQDPLNFAFAKKAGEVATRESKLPEELRREKNPYGFVGRDSAILELERAMRRPPPAILIQGLGGVGKTTLAKGFLQWLDQTGGLENPPFWFFFQEIRSAEFVFNRMGEALFEKKFPTFSMERKIELLVSELRENNFVIVWDNFESASGIAGAAVEANLLDSDRNLLAQFLDELRGGKTKIIITSRSREEWLGPERRFLLSLGGLDGEERWEFCNAILRDLGMKINRDDKDLVELMDQLSGHPLAMRVVLPRLEIMSAGQVLTALRSNLAALNPIGDGEQAKLYATLAFVEKSLPEDLRRLLVVIGMHEGFVDANMLVAIAREADAGWSRDKIDVLMLALGSAGLLRDIGYETYEMHPLLTSYLRAAHTGNGEALEQDALVRAFVDAMSVLANELAHREPHQQRFGFYLHGQNFYHALTEAERLGMLTNAAALMQALAIFALDGRNFVTAQRLYEQYAVLRKSSGTPGAEAGAYHQLGRVAEEQQDFAAAREWYRKSLAISEQAGNEQGAAITYHQLGVLAHAQRDISSAREWYRKSLVIKEKLGDERGAAETYHQLGLIAAEQGRFSEAEQWYRKSLIIEEKLGPKEGTASTYHTLGSLALRQGDVAAAEQLYRKSLTVNMQLDNNEGVVMNYYQLGMTAAKQGDLPAAEMWCRKSLAISEKLGIAQYSAANYDQLGSIALAQGNLTEAEQWYLKSLTIKENLGNQHSTAFTYGNLGLLLSSRGSFLDGGEWLIKSVLAFLNTRDEHLAAQNVRNFMRHYTRTPSEEQEKLKAMWQEAGLGELPNDSGP